MSPNMSKDNVTSAATKIEPLKYMPGFGNNLETEALPGRCPKV